MAGSPTPNHRYDLKKATDRALRHVHVSGAVDCTPKDFAEALETGSTDRRTRRAVELFLSEGEEHAMVAIVTQRSSTFATMAKLARELLPPGHPTTRFLTEPPL